MNERFYVRSFITNELKRRQNIFKKFGSIGHAVAALAQDFSGAHTLKQRAAGRPIPLLKISHYPLHPATREVSVFSGKTDNHPGTNQRPTSPLHIPHPCAISSGNVHSHILRKADNVTISADNSLRTIMRIAAFLFRRQMFPCFHNTNITILRSDYILLSHSRYD